MTKIEWTNFTWNPVTGCTKVSPGCKNCYAERMACRLQSMGCDKYERGFQVACHTETLDIPLRMKKPRMIFVNSMSDLFHNKIPFEFLKNIFDVMNRCPQHQFQILTKRSTLLAELAPRLNWTPNIWMGVTVENSKYLYRIDDLRTVPARIRFVSFEPLLEGVEKIDLSGIHWVICGGETGPGARGFWPGWAIDLKDLCVACGVAFFFKQYGDAFVPRISDPKSRRLDGQEWNEFPNV